jgi:hypothetical protein
MSKMHELLAVEEEIVGRSNSIIEETLVTFKNKSVEFYEGKTKTYKPLDDADVELVPPVQKEIIDSVPAKLKYTFGKVAEEYDFLLQKECTNRTAVADIVIDGKTLLADAPVDFLLTVERRLDKVRHVILDAPTLPNGPKWVPDTQRGDGFYKLAEPEVSYRTRTTPVAVVLYPHTDKHPAQVKEGSETKTVGTFTEMKFDGRMTSHDKSILLERVDTLLREVKKAIRRANQAEVIERKVGTAVFDYIMNGNLGV